MKTTVDANLFRLVAPAVSREGIRYYLNGVSIEPHPEKGVIMAATDGHRLLVAYDVDGHCEDKIIVRLPSYVMQQCKSKPMFGATRLLEVDHEERQAKAVNVTPGKREEDPKTYQDVVTAHSVLIDGTFPDWRRVVPNMADEPAGAIAVGFNSKYIKEFGALGLEISKTLGGSGAFVIHKQNGMSPTIIRWSGVRNVFGVFMPMRFDERDNILPEFVKQPVPLAAE